MNQKQLDNEVHKAITERVRSRICDIGDATGNMIKHAGKVYIVTCRHVADYFFEKDKSYIPLKDNNRIQFDQLKYCGRTNSILDIALIEVLDINLVRDYYESQDFEIIDDFRQHDFSEINLFICGFPEQLCIRKDQMKKNIYFSFGANISNDRPSNKDFIYLKYDRESDSNITTEGLLTKLPKAPGLSGAFIFKVETFKGEKTDIWQPSFAKIIAIQSTWNEKNWLKSTNIKYLFELLENNKYA